MKRKTLMACAIVIGTFLPGTSEGQDSFCDRYWCGAVGYAVGSNPSGVVAADFNGDRRLDLAVTSESPDKVGVLRNAGDGKFAAPVNVALAGGSGPHSLAAADFDDDGDVDLVVSRQNEDDVQLLMNTSGVLSPGAITGVDGTDPRQVVAGDLDGNGFVDVVTVNRGSDSISVLLNSGGVLAEAVTYAVGAEPRSLALGYLDNNASLDLAVASHDLRQVELYLNDGAGAFVAGSSLFVGAELRPEGVAIGDLDADGDEDIACSTTATAGGFVSVFLNSGSATFGAPVHHDSDATDPSAIVIADFDLAFGNDIAVLNGGVQNPITGDIEWLIAILSNTGAADFGSPELIQVGTSPEALVAADLFTNGAFHLVSADQDDGTVSVVKNNNVILASGFEWGDTFPWSRTVPELP